LSSRRIQYEACDDDGEAYDEDDGGYGDDEYAGEEGASSVRSFVVVGIDKQRGTSR
jgi:hypothetical protein